MSRTDLCRQQRDQEVKNLKSFLKASLIVSAGIHGLGFVWLLTHAGNQSHQAEIPIDIVTLAPEEAKTAPSNSAPSERSPAPLAYLPAPEAATAIPGSAASETPSTSAGSTTPSEAQPATALPPAVQSSSSDRSTPDSSTAITDAQSPRSPAPANTPAASAPAAVPSAANRSWLQTLRDRVSALVGAPRHSTTATRGQGSGQSATTGRASSSPSAPSLGLGASSLGGLVSRNLDNGQSAFSRTAQAEQPVCVVCSKPLYPKQSQNLGRTGKVQIGVNTDRNGVVTGYYVIRSSGHADMDRAALDAAKTWKFKPTAAGYSGFVANIEYRSQETNPSLSVAPAPARTRRAPLITPPPRSRPANAQPSVHDLLPSDPASSQATTPPQLPAEPAPRSPQPSAPAPVDATTPGVAALEQSITAPASGLESGRGSLLPTTPQ